MGKKDFLQNKYEEINKLKNMLQGYPNEYKENIIRAIDKITDEINGYLEKNKIQATKKNRQPTIPIDNFTLEQLAKYNGQDGSKSYVAVNGIVYDVSNILQWQGGQHYGLMAGSDLTANFPTCHGDNTNIFENAIIVGKLVQSQRIDFCRYSIEELAKFDGLEDRSAYVAIDGTVYDVTPIKCWFDGKHYGLKAGLDLSEFFNTCHSKEREILKKLRVVGTIKQ